MNKPLVDPHLLYWDWTLTETQFDPDQLNYKETVFTIGNGYLGTRGTFEETYPGAVPATLIHGVYDDIAIAHTELASCPDWLLLAIFIDGEDFRMDRGEVLRYQRQLDLKRAVLSRSLCWRSPKGKTIEIEIERFASQADPHILAMRCQLTPLDFEGSIQVKASIDSTPDNDGFNHWVRLDQGYYNESAWLHARTRNSNVDLGMATRLSLAGIEGLLKDASVPEYPTVEAIFQAAPGQTAILEKITTIFTSREVDAPLQMAQDRLLTLAGYDDLLAAHERAWDDVWQKSDIEIEGNPQAQLVLRYNLFQLLISAPRDDDRISIPAKTLSGFGYRGHIFWDTEFFILPFFIFTQPEIARNLLTYRYHTLEGARRKAAHYGYRGAMYAWESADTGDEVTPRWLPQDNPYEEDIRIWCRDREIHVSADIAFASWLYWRVTGDDEWMRDYGAEILLDTAHFWSSRVEYNVKRECWEIREVIGPDEYHENANNNAFTNRMAQWNLATALSIYNWLSQTFPEQATHLETKLEITPKRRWRWQDMADNLWIPYDSETGMFEQFEGFFDLEDIDLADYEPRSRSMEAIFTLKGTSQRQVLKQPDVLMLLYLLGTFPETDYGKDVLRKNWEYYTPRTDLSYGSSLGPAIQGLVAGSLGHTAEANQCFRLASLVDLEDLRGNTASGIHGASCGGVWQAIVFGAAGLQLTEEGPVAHPHLPPTWKSLKFRLCWRGTCQEFNLRPEAAGGEAEIRGLIFDLDGVLTNTAEFHYQAWQRLADEEGLPFNREANEALRGISRRDSLMQIIGKRPYSDSQIQAMMERKNRYYLELLQQAGPDDLLPGAGQLLDELHAAGLKIAIGSGSKNARSEIKRLGIADRLDAIADGNSVQRPKPAPDLFLHAASQLGLEPAQCVVVEDATSGIEAALAGGMLTVGIGPAERVGEAHVVLPNLEGVHWTDLWEKLGTGAAAPDT